MTSGGRSDKLSRGFTAVKVIFFIVFLILIVTFVVKNMGAVDLYYYDYKLQLQSVRAPLLAVILASFALGFSLAWMFGFVSRMQLKSRVRKQTKTIQDMNDEMQRLKSSKDVVNH
jgi:uncharacterized integral membrane protein